MQFTYPADYVGDRVKFLADSSQEREGGSMSHQGGVAALAAQRR